MFLNQKVTLKLDIPEVSLSHSKLSLSGLQDQLDNLLVLTLKLQTYDFTLKYAKWFKDIGDKRLFKEVNLDYEDYERFKLVKPSNIQI